MEIKVKGHSGCRIDIRREAGQIILRKTTGNRDYRARLLQQGVKQQAFAKTPPGLGVSAPEVLGFIDDTDMAGMEMQYVFAHSFVDFFEGSFHTSADAVAEKLIRFLEWELEQSPVREIDADLLSSKFQSVMDKVLADQVLGKDPEIAAIMERAATLFGVRRNRRWPVGRCHGDLTFSNMLFRDDQIFLIDFLDSFIESPLIDLVKIRQDSRYFWSHLLFEGDFDRIKSKIALDHIDHLVWSHFQNREWVRDGYKELQCMNFLRILQYAHDPVIIAFLKQILKDLLK